MSIDYRLKVEVKMPMKINLTDVIVNGVTNLSQFLPVMKMALNRQRLWQVNA